MRALTFHGKHDIRCESVPDPKIEASTDAVIRITSCAICGSDLHIYNGVIPDVHSGDVLGHENMGEVVEVGSEVSNLKVGDRVVVPFVIACGECFFCKRGAFSGCERSNPAESKKKAETMWGHSPAGLFGYSHLLGGFPGGQAEYLRVPYADVGPIKVPAGLTDEQVLFLSDIFPTGYMAADFCDIQQGDTIAIWGCGPVGQMAIRSAFLLGAERVIAIDTVPERLELAQSAGAITIDFLDEDVYDQDSGTDQRPRRRRVHRCGWHRAARQLFLLLNGRPGEGRHIHGNRPATRSTPSHPLHPQFRYRLGRGRVWRISRQNTVRVRDQSGPDHADGPDPGSQIPAQVASAHREWRLDPSFVITHRASLEEGPDLYKMFNDKKDGCIKVVLKP